MAKNSSASMFGGAGGRGARASVSTLDGLRKVLGNQTETDSAPIAKAAAQPTASAAPSGYDTPVAPLPSEDNKQELRTLNNRLSGYLDRVRQLQNDNENLQKQIDDILAKRKIPEGRDWDEILKPLDHLKKQIKDSTDDNAKLLLQIDNSKLAKEDFNNKLDDENKACIELEKDLEALRRTKDDIKMNCEQNKKEIEMVKEELERLKQEHKNEVNSLLEKIKDSDVNVEIKSQDSSLADIIKNVRVHYDKIAEKNLKEADDWYKDKFEPIKVEEAKNTETLKSETNELKSLMKKKQNVEIQIQASKSTIRNLEETLRNIKMENSQRLGPSNKIILDLERDLRNVRSQVEQQLEINKALLCIKMKLEKEIEQYHELLSGLTADPERPNES
ncbi:keratin, type I cytoskeletal 18-like [Archocentrus centrarchus]|uniref:keratin, type I cytoskeletal 18-like n=1 Tax=Archocentrus centrarchus TaxID=63155 RepID=UPI0011E9B341|nr:keratin, type I cytoskeletal 18-like [Archocentrus centrarchus]